MQLSTAVLSDTISMTQQWQHHSSASRWWQFSGIKDQNLL